ncbi:MAG: hypothetical protein ACC608_03160 [Anaerofustis sp.]
MTNFDIAYNYLIEDYAENFPLNFCIDKRTDPDSISEKLYDDILKAFFPKNYDAEKLEQQFGVKPKFYTIKLNNTTLLSSDYIGPSVYWSREKGVNDNKIRGFLKQCHTIGGHIVWERGADLKYKVNTSRGGSSGVYDRLDWTLLLLKIYLSDKDKKNFIIEANKCIQEEFRNTKNINEKFENLFNAFNCSEWLKGYSFKDFCMQFKLYGNFVDSQFNIIEMAPLFPVLPNDYNAYIDNVCKAIDSRKALINSGINELL